MRYKTREFIFHRTYEMASLVETCVSNWKSFIEIDWENPNVIKCVFECSKQSLLHFYTYAMIAIEEREEILQNHDMYEEFDDARKELQSDFDAYQIECLPYVGTAPLQNTPSSDNDLWFRQWFFSQEEKFELLWEKMADEVFHLLFGNRSFLLQFNQSLSSYLQSGRVCIPTNLLDGKGVIKRQTYFPSWVKRAIFYRDQGRCVLCQRDLTGLVSTDQNIHIDHIVPLNLWGTNDPCNLQLLCEDCNLRKSGTISKTARRYSPWWNY